MKVKRICFASDWKNINIENDKIDISVSTDDGYVYTLRVATPKYIKSLMDNEKMNYYGPNYPFIFVKTLTKETIEEAANAYAENSDGYWLKIYHFLGWYGVIDESVFDYLKAEHLKMFRKHEEQDEDDLDNGNGIE